MSGEIKPTGSGNEDPSLQGPNDHDAELAFFDKHIREGTPEFEARPDFRGTEFNEALMRADAEADAVRGMQNIAALAEQLIPKELEPHTMKELLGARGVEGDVREAKLFGRDEGYKKVFEQALDQGSHDPNSIAISEANVFTFSVLPYLPPSRIILTSRNSLELEWAYRSMKILAATESPKEYQEALWQSDSLLRQLTDAGRDVDELKEGLDRERQLLDRMHFLASDRQFAQAKQAITSGEKTVGVAAFNITTEGKHGFGAWLKQQPEAEGKPITWCNLGSLGDHFYFPLINLVKRNELPLAPDCTFLASTQVRYEDPDNLFLGELQLDLPPKAYSCLGGVAFNKQVMRGMSAYKV